jgi:hypothetical protein
MKLLRPWLIGAALLGVAVPVLLWHHSATLRRAQEGRAGQANNDTIHLPGRRESRISGSGWFILNRLRT